MKELTGSPKQIQWAEQLREVFVQIKEDFIRNMIPYLNRVKGTKPMFRKPFLKGSIGEYLEILEIIEGQESSEFWINNRKKFNDYPFSDPKTWEKIKKVTSENFDKTKEAGYCYFTAKKGGKNEH